jgi:hypothetical protein
MIFKESPVAQNDRTEQAHRPGVFLKGKFLACLMPGRKRVGRSGKLGERKNILKRLNTRSMNGVRR